jgi:uncharacterized protein
MSFRLVTALVCFLSGSSLLQAQTTVTQPIMGSESTQEQSPQTVTDTYRILVIGDALAGGLGAGLSRMSEADSDSDIEVVNRFQETSGIARPEVYDWTESLPKIMEGKEFDAVVVLIGANDRQSIKVGDFRYVFGTPEWLESYKALTGQLLDTLKASNARIFWVAIPPMGDAKYEADMQMLAALQKEQVQLKGATYVDLRSNFLNPDGTYTDKGPDDTGEVRKLRARDGFAFFKQGNNRFGQLLLTEIKKDMVSVPADVAASPPEQTVSVPMTNLETVPMFGQESVGGSFATYQPDNVKTSDATKMLAGAGAATSVSREDLLPGSKAEQLFVQGESPPAPIGRFDDFSIAPPAP